MINPDDIKASYILGQADALMLRELALRACWNSVDKRLPSDATQCVVKTIFDGVYAIQYWDSNSGTWLGDDYSYDADEVTHWMPLPEPPA